MLPDMAYASSEYSNTQSVEAQGWPPKIKDPWACARCATIIAACAYSGQCLIDAGAENCLKCL